MIHRNSQTLQIPDWQNTLSQSIKDPERLFAALELPMEYLPRAMQAQQLFPLRASLPFVSRMQKGDINDPLLRQILPIDHETRHVVGFQPDPVGDQAAEILPGLIHKYHGRVLLTLTGACGIHCRYCFRRQFDYQHSNPTRQNWQQVLRYIAAEKSIHEVILSGGDPLSLSDSRLQALVAGLEQIPHIRFLRIHTRLPIVVPERITPELLTWLRNLSLKVFMVLHINHAQEIDAEVEHAIDQLKNNHIDLLNQSVLLRKVNDNAASLIDLSLRLGEIGIIPYYLHLLDKVTGASHFDVPQQQGIAIIEIMRRHLPGYLIPRLVAEVTGEPYKRPIY